MYAGDTEGVGGLALARWPRLASPQWMRARWTSDPCYAFFGVDGTECSFVIYLSEVEWFCPPLPWRNQTATQMAHKPLPKVQVGLGGRWASWPPQAGHPWGTVGGSLVPGGVRLASSACWTGSQPDGALSYPVGLLQSLRGRRGPGATPLMH